MQIKKSINIEVTNGISCDDKFIYIQFEYNAISLKAKSFGEAASKIRSFSDDSKINYNISCKPQFDIIMNYGKNPTYLEELSLEQKKELFSKLEYVKN